MFSPLNRWLMLEVNLRPRRGCVAPSLKDGYPGAVEKDWAGMTPEELLSLLDAQTAYEFIDGQLLGRRPWIFRRRRSI
jgi:hypothetical protein